MGAQSLSRQSSVGESACPGTPTDPPPHEVKEGAPWASVPADLSNAGLHEDHDSWLAVARGQGRIIMMGISARTPMKIVGPFVCDMRCACKQRPKDT